MNDLAPIVLFVYARPVHTRRTLEALAANPEAKNSVLYIFADGPPGGAPADLLANVAEVRKIIREHPWCGQVRTFESEYNLGLADSIVKGVTEVVERHSRVIVLEDDIVVQPGFLRYMNDALEIYKDEPRVFQVSGFMVPMRWSWESTGFLRVSTSWGWATWSRAWKKFRVDAEAMRDEILASEQRKAFDLEGCSFHFDELERNVRGELHTWAVKWYASIFLNKGLCLYPRKPLLLNCGFDGTGVNCHYDNTGTAVPLATARNIAIRGISVVESRMFLKATQRYYIRQFQAWTGTRVSDRIARKLRKLILRK
jgi:hypothetical protein